MPDPQLIPGQQDPYAAIKAAAGAGGAALPSPSAALSLPQGPTPVSASPAAAASQPDPLVPVMARISQGESGGDDNARFGFPDLPGAAGPAGPSHALRKYQFEPDTWTRAASEYASLHPNEPAPNFNNPASEEKVARYWATKTYGRDANGRSLPEAAAANAVDYSRLAGQWPSLAPKPSIASGLIDTWQADRAKRQKELDRIGSETQKLMGAALAGDPEAAETHELIRRAQEQSEKYQQAALDLASKPPPTPQDALRNFGGIATVLGIIGGLFTRQPLAASLEAGAAAMNAYNNNDQQAYQRSFDAWKYHSDMLLKMAQFQHESMRDILYDEHMENQEKLSRLQIAMGALGNERLAAMAGSGDYGGLIRAQVDLQNASTRLTEARAKIENMAELTRIRDKMTPLQNKLFDQSMKEAQAAGINPDFDQQLQMAQKAAAAVKTGAATGLAQYGEPPREPSQSGEPADVDHPPASGPGSNIPQSVWDAATQFVLTNHMPTLGQNAAGRAQILAAEPFVRAARGMRPSDVTQQGIAYSGALAGQAALSRRIANLDVGLSEVPHLGEVLENVADATPSTNSMTVNRLLQAYQYQVGDPQVVKLGAAMNEFLQGYARAVNPTGQITDDIRSHVDGVLNQAMARGQIRAGVDQLVQGLQQMKLGLGDAQQHLHEFYPVPGEPKKPAAAEGAAHPPVIQNGWRYEWKDGSYQPVSQAQ